MIKKIAPLLLVMLAAYVGVEQFSSEGSISSPKNASTASASHHSRHADGQTDAIANAYRNKAHDVPVQGQGKVIKVLPDDTRGSQHQRFLLRLGSNQTVLVAHNIDLASRLQNLHAGDTVRFKGIYEWNDQGGVVHWTHRDPSGRHTAGWLEHDGQTVQ